MSPSDNMGSVKLDRTDSICSGGVGGYSYAWDNGDATQSISVSPSLDQIYCVTGTDANGCSSGQVCLTVSVNPAINLLAFSDQTICMGDAASISALATFSCMFLIFVFFYSKHSVFYLMQIISLNAFVFLISIVGGGQKNLMYVTPLLILFMMIVFHEIYLKYQSYIKYRKKTKI